MNANQVVIVMDREKAERWVSDAGQPDDLIENDIARALLRDPDELVERIARAIAAGAKSNCFERLDTGLEIRRVEQQCDRYRKQANAVLHALQEGTK